MKKIEIIYGIHSAVSALNNPERKIYSWECTKETFSKIKNKLKNKKIPPFRIVERRFLDQKLKNNFHQGISVNSEKLKEKNLFDCIDNNSSILILDSLTDSQNVGAIIRSAYLFNIKLIIYNDNNSFDVNSTLIKSACGAYEKINLVKVININNTISILKKKNFWVIGVDSNGKSDVSEIKEGIKKVIIIGSENRGIRTLIKRNCDFLVRVAMLNKNDIIDSLNVSNLASIVFYELNKKKK